MSFQMKVYPKKRNLQSHHSTLRDTSQHHSSLLSLHYSRRSVFPALIASLEAMPFSLKPWIHETTLMSPWLPRIWSGQALNMMSIRCSDTISYSFPVLCPLAVTDEVQAIIMLMTGIYKFF